MCDILLVCVLAVRKARDVVYWSRYLRINVVNSVEMLINLDYELHSKKVVAMYTRNNNKTMSVYVAG